MAKQSSWWKELIGALVPAASSAATTFKTAARETLEEAQARVRETTRMVMKAATVFFIIALGAIYVLNGLGTYLETVNGWYNGFGSIVIGGILVLLGLFAMLMRK